MRILAVRGRNLASLAGDFEVRLDDGPLKTAGVFAITGPTGSGKSTLLDAMCLALFDTTPRLIAAAGAKIGREDEPEDTRIGANDVRNLLRKGTGEGYVEVEFVGVDGRTYRARWEVRRAHLNPSRRLQKTGMTLVAVESGEPMGGTKTEVLQGIEARLGLSFEQFRRSVLLAQGDFAAFLDAKDSERGSLLERITGTEIYTEISKKGFERAREEKQELKSLADRQEAIDLLTDELREATAARVESLKAQAARKHIIYK